MGPDAWITLAAVGGLMAALAANRVGVDLLMLAALAVVLLAGVVTPSTAFSGFANEGLLTVAFLYVVAAGLRQSGVVHLLSARLLGRPRSELDAQARVVVPVTVISAFMNNTPLVAVYLPMIDGFARRHGVAVSRLLLPLSYAAILGGVCTLIGTSTNVVVNGLVLAHNRQPGVTPIEPLALFSLTPIGVPVALAGVLYLLAAGRTLLPRRRSPAEADDAHRRQYTVAMRVASSAALVGRRLDAAGLRHLPGLFLAHIERDGELEHAVGPDEVIRADDVLVFVGVLESVADLQQIRGLLPIAWDAGLGARPDHRLIEAVISPSSPLVGRTIRDGGFRTHYGGVIVAVHRHGERLSGKLGDIRLRPGDTLLIEAPAGFETRHRHSPAFHLVTEHAGAVVPRHERAWLAMAVVGGFVLACLAGLDTLTAAMLAAAAMVVFGCVDGAAARAAVDWPVLVVIGAGIGLGSAVESSGLARVLADQMLALTRGGSPVAVIAGIYALTWVLTTVLSNSAAAVIVFPVAAQAAEGAGVPLRPLVLAIAIAASCEFTTPVGYQTNLMVLGPGGYRPWDYVRFGGPLTLLCGAVTVTLLSLWYL